MKTQNTIKYVATYAILMLATASFSQQFQHFGHQGGTVPPNTSATASYAGQQTRTIKALSASEAQDLIDGKGMGLAKAAELNGYPGPMHVLELAKGLQLTPEQRVATVALMQTHKREVRGLGAELVDAERRLDDAFKTGKTTPEEIARLTQHIGRLQATVRNAHLQTHLAQTALLDASQIESYQVLRGYRGKTVDHMHLNAN
jgi:Heavy-metal resistance